MPSITNLSKQEIDEIQARLKRIEGQAKGVQKMVDDGRDCIEILNQLSAIKAAVTGLSGELLEAYAMRCLLHPEEFATQETAIHEAVKALVRSGR